MDLFWELALTVALFLLLPVIFVKLLSVPPHHDASAKAAIAERELQVESNIYNWETEQVIPKAGKVDKLGKESILEKLIDPEIVEVSCGSPKIHNRERDDKNSFYNEIEVVDLTEKPVPLFECEENFSFDEGSQRTGISDELELIEAESRVTKVEENEISHCDSNCDGIDVFRSDRVENENRALRFLDEDDWEGVERTESERLFSSAVVYVASKSNANRISSLSDDVKLQLYGLHKIATQGPCREPQPMALKFSARAKWNAWQQLGSMSPELAMERYITILSESIPDWMPDYHNENQKPVSSEMQHVKKQRFSVKTYLHYQMAA
ncbi:hypothetical protein L6164_027891 [Bauhinia variegata]|uniref:Uncharacterized protein n=1 Tax=Bauhinia variegata TaxID=167791 RepID=A0ACB9LUR4_BAUVA|nr:hypothetical protein L6164_027891 [Bauhinia variegata]